MTADKDWYVLISLLLLSIIGIGITISCIITSKALRRKLIRANRGHSLPG